MFSRSKEVIVESYLGVVALGYLLAQIILHFANIFAMPVQGWISRKTYGGLLPNGGVLPGFSLRDALPEVIQTTVMLLVWFALLRWLYLNPRTKETSE